MNGLTSYILSKKYVESIADSLGAVKGAPCTIKSITEVEGGQKVTFEWTGTSGTKQTSDMTVKNGVSITNISVDANNYLVCTMSDGTEQKAKINFLDNVYTKTETDNLLKDKAEKIHNHDDVYAAKDKEHEHTNKETLDKFGVNDSGKLTFNGNVVTPEASDLSDYLKKTDAQNTYVAQEAGKGLSENDFTTVLKEAYDKAVEDSHTHTNKSVIDKFSESADGALLYDGQSIEADLSDVYKKTEADEKFVTKELGKGLSTNDLTDELKSTYDEAVTAKHTHENGTVLDGITSDDISQITKNKDAIATLNGTGEGSVDKKIADKLSEQTYLTKEIATADEVAAYIADPTTAKFNVIYLVKDESVSGSDKYFEYQRIGNEESSTFEMTGDTSTNLADYAKTVDVNTELGKKVATTDIIDNLVSDATDKPLSAAQGKALDGKFADYTKTNDLATVATSGSYNDLTDLPEFETVDIDFKTEY